ncbi:MAG TPA: ATP-binding protein [Chroococcales cyanobacterium]
MSKPLRVLIVEDSQDDAELVAYELKRGGYDSVVERVDTPTAMKTALDKQQWDIIIADYTLPSFSAPAALNLLKERGLDLPFIVVSGTIGEDRAVAAMKAGAHDYVMKDNLARLSPAVERELREADERRKLHVAEETVRQNEERFRLLIENALDIITVLGNDGIIHYESPSLERVLGYKPEDLVQKNILDYVHPEDVETFLDALNQVTQNPTLTLSIEFRFQHHNGSWRILEAIGKQFLASSELSSIVLNSRDITERKRAEELRQTLERERELSEERFNLVSMMSHEFRNPLSSIVLASELLKKIDNLSLAEKKDRYLNQISVSAKEMTQLLDDVLNLSKAEVGKLEIDPQPLNLVEFCQNLVEGVQMNTSPKHTIALLIQGECDRACMDEKLLWHVLSNLLSNAIKYSPEGGHVRFELCCKPVEAIFRIQDDGIGIPLDDRQKLFESFHRGKNVGKIPGTGLGLCIVKRYVDLLGGQITLESEVGVGSIFTATLPLHSVTSAPFPQPICTSNH